MFPVSQEGAIEFSAATPAWFVLDAVEAELQRIRACTIEREGARLRFRPRFFGTYSNWNLLGTVHDGTLRVAPHGVGQAACYETRSRFWTSIPLLTVFLALFAQPAQWPRYLAISVSIWVANEAYDRLVRGNLFRLLLRHAVERAERDWRVRTTAPQSDRQSRGSR
jgi:hypothetical protein